MVPGTVFSVAAFALFADICVAACTRQELSTAASTFLQNAIDKVEYKTAPNVKVSQNMRMVDGLKATAYGNITHNLKPNFTLLAVDTEKCEVARLVLVNEGNGPAPTKNSTAGATILSYRIKLSGPGGLATEIEMLNTNRDGKPSFFQPFAYPDTTPAFWSHQDSFKRDELFRIAESYTTGIEKACPSCVLSTPSCARIENGWRIPVNCNAKFDEMGFPIYGRRWVIDTVSGIALGAYFFGGDAEGGLFTHEWFAIKDGYIQEVQANFLLTKPSMPDVWTAGGGVPKDWVRPKEAKPKSPRGPIPKEVSGLR